MQRRPSEPRPDPLAGLPHYPADPRPGTYALVLELRRRCTVPIGSLRRISFELPFCLYIGSAFGPGGLAARLAHHLRVPRCSHWHIEHLRQAAVIRQIWFTVDPRRLECTWAKAASGLANSSAVAGFGSSDCGCASHLIGLRSLPNKRSFRREVLKLAPRCHPIRELLM